MLEHTYSTRNEGMTGLFDSSSIYVHVLVAALGRLGGNRCSKFFQNCPENAAPRSGVLYIFN